VVKTPAATTMTLGLNQRTSEAQMEMQEQGDDDQQLPSYVEALDVEAAAAQAKRSSSSPSAQHVVTIEVQQRHSSTSGDPLTAV